MDSACSPAMDTSWKPMDQNSEEQGRLEEMLTVNVKSGSTIAGLKSEVKHRI